MCGIIGYVGKDRFSWDRFLACRDLMIHRGPDDAGAWKSPDGSVMLGNRRLAILDLSPAGHQPMVDEEDKLVITHNGEIYNYVELRAELEGCGHRFRSNSDTEVLLAAYKEWGADCLRHLNGMFAFAIWDEKRRELFAARDRFGEKPFYYYHDPKRTLFLFASELKALLASGLIPTKSNYKAIYRYLAHREIDVGADTLFEGILALPPAYALIYSRTCNTLKIWRYWDLDPDAELILPNDQAYAERLLELLTDAVRIRLRSDVPVGSSLSGGLDSSTIVCLIAKQLRSGIQKTFSARFHDPRYDEGKHIEKVIEWANVKGHIVYPDPARLPEEIKALSWHQEQPFFSTSIYAQWNVMRLAKEQGVTVLLDGQGGDEILAGYHTYFGPYFRELLLNLHWGMLARNFYLYVREHGTGNLPVIFFTLLPRPIRHPLRKQMRPLAIPPEFEKRWGDEKEFPSPKFKEALQQSLYETLTRTMLPALLRYADRTSMAFSREVRLPFLDHRLVEFLFAIPTNQKIRHATTKFILRNAIVGVVPEEIRLRKDKLGFAPPEVVWLKGPLKDWIEEVLHSTQFRQREWIDSKVVDRVWKEFLDGRDAWHSLIWRLVSLEIWAQLFLDEKRWFSPRCR